jgi:hypothetical protein
MTMQGYIALKETRYTELNVPCVYLLHGVRSTPSDAFYWHKSLQRRREPTQCNTGDDIIGTVGYVSSTVPDTTLAPRTCRFSTGWVLEPITHQDVYESLYSQ